MNKQESNKLLAEFMGFEWYEINKPYIAVREPNGGIRHFSTDWNDLMQIVEKIEKLSYRRGRPFYLHLTKSYAQIKIDRMNEELFSKWGATNNKIGAVYSACVEFVQWHNNQNK